ncbi:MAG: DUF4845 domain-containing protein [Halioglobus sp.]|nr:DUF4845 domain-containing protein [Halioglobus sp.]
MNTRQRQLGMSMPAMLIIAIMVGFFVMCAIRLAPPYFEYLSVKEIVGKVASEPGADEKSVAEIRRKIDSLFNTNQIYELQSKDVQVYRKEGKTYIDASYEVRKPVAGNIDAVMKFDDLMYTVGSPVP